MARIDEIKELLNSLRIWLTLSVGLIVILSGGLVNRYDNQRIDFIFWAGVVLLFILMLAILLLIMKISKRTKEIGDIK